MVHYQIHYSVSSENLPFENREFAFVLKNGSFLQYYSFERVDQLKATIKSLYPKSISLGPVYTNKVSHTHQQYLCNTFLWQGYTINFEIVYDRYLTHFNHKWKHLTPAIMQLTWIFIDYSFEYIHTETLPWSLQTSTSMQPKAHRKLSPASFHFLGKELVFDIDIDAYDNIRQCCSGHSMCTSCWKFLVVAIKVVDRALHSKFIQCKLQIP